MSAADRFDDDPLSLDPEHPDLGWTISEEVPFEEWPNGKPSGAWRTWKRAHDRCSVWWCWRRRWKRRPTFGSHGRCWRHLDPTSCRCLVREGCTKNGCPS